jgi:hypothetical protein
VRAKNGSEVKHALSTALTSTTRGWDSLVPEIVALLNGIYFVLTPR